MIANLNDVAYWFVNNNKDISRQNKEGNLKLQKLLYYSQAMYLVINDKQPLFNEKIEAWRDGPVVPIIYEAYRYRNLVSEAVTNTNKLNEIDQKTKKILQIINYVFGDLSAAELVRKTHLDKPWASRKKLVREKQNPELPKEELYEEYQYLKELYDAYLDTDFDEFKQFILCGITYTYKDDLSLSNEEISDLKSYSNSDNTSFFVYRDTNGELVVY